MTITLQLSTENGIVSEVIRTWTRAWCSHVDIIMPDGMLLGARSEAVELGEGRFIPAGVQKRPVGYAPFTKTEHLVFDAGPICAKQFYAFLEAQIGKPYDKVAIAGLVLDRDWRNPDRWFCSELAMAALETAGLLHPISSSVNFISPRDLLILGEAMGLNVG